MGGSTSSNCLTTDTTYTWHAHRVVVPLILARGSGARLWPLSRKMFPKQFVHFFGDGASTFLGSTLKRLHVGGVLAASHLVWAIIAENGVDTIIHLAGSIIGPGSARDPLSYYFNATPLADYHDRHPHSTTSSTGRLVVTVSLLA